MVKHGRILDRDRSLLMVIDLQESYRGKLLEESRIVTATARLLDAAGILDLPVVISEQYPKGLGPTRKEIEAHLPEQIQRFEKTTFSFLRVDGVREHLESLGRNQVVVAGIETHVCVSQTVHDLLAADFQPHVVRDAIGARFGLEDETGFAKMVGSGAIPTSVEAVLFEWLGNSRAPEFKAIQSLVV